MSLNNSTAPPEWDILLSSAQKNLSDKILSLIKDDRVDPNHANRVSQSALHIAALWANVESVAVLLECGADPNAQNTMTGATPLHCAVQSSKASSLERQVQTIQVLVEAGADPSRGDFFGSTPLDYCEDDQVLKEILQVQVPPVFISIAEQNAQHLSSILQEDASVVQSRHDSLTPLLCIVNMLVDNRNEENVVCLEMMRLLLEHGANPNEKPTVHRNGHLNVQEDPGDAALYRICTSLKNNTTDECLKNAALLLKEYNATVTPATQNLLHDAARRNNVDFVQFLLVEMEMDPNVQGRQGMTPLQFAARSGKTEMVELLLKQGADANIQDDRGQTALEAARVNEKNDIVALLELHTTDNKSSS